MQHNRQSMFYKDRQIQCMTVLYLMLNKKQNITT